MKNYSSTILLLLGLLAGGVAGVVMKDGASILHPVGAFFLNLVFTLVVPLVFFSVAGSMVTMHRSGVVGKVLGIALGVFLGMSMIAGVFSYGLMSVWNPFEGMEAAGGKEAGIFSGGMDLGEAVVAAFTVDDFPLLFSREHLLPLIIFAALFGLAVALLGQKAEVVRTFVDEGGAVIMKMMEIIMMFAPIGIGCYFADIIGRLGGQVVGVYMKIFLVVCVGSAVCYFLFYSLYAIFCRVPLGKFWKEMITPSVTAVGTCSSAACIGVNIKAARNLDVSANIADGVIPLGTNLHKDGSVIVSVAKVLFALYFFGASPNGLGIAIMVILLSILESVVLGAIPVGGMTGEILICAVLGLDPSFAATLMIIGTICDIPATLVNASGNLIASLLVQRFMGVRKEA